MQILLSARQNPFHPQYASKGEKIANPFESHLTAEELKRDVFDIDFEASPLDHLEALYDDDAMQNEAAEEAALLQLQALFLKPGSDAE